MGKISDWAREHGYLKPDEEDKTSPSGVQTTGVQATIVSSVTNQQSTVSSYTPKKADDPERKKFVEIFFSTLRRISPKFFELKEFIRKFEKTIGTERERYTTALSLSNSAPADMLMQIASMETALSSEMSTAINQLTASGERELSDKKMQAENLAKKIADVQRELATLESDKNNLAQELAKIQQAHEEIINSVKSAAAEVQNELAEAKAKIAQYGSAA